MLASNPDPGEKMPRNSKLRKLLSRIASKLRIRQKAEDPEDPPPQDPEYITIIYVKDSGVYVHKMPFSDHTTVEDVKESFQDIRSLCWEDAMKLLKSIPPVHTNREMPYSVIGYPRSEWIMGSTFTLKELLHPWNPTQAQFFVNVITPAVTTVSTEYAYTDIYRQLQTYNASQIPGRVSSRRFEELEMFWAGMIARYNLERPGNIGR
ncbi:hypothetical protein TWF481_009717 [Arthrobotrys musiformis]|uniref:Uncharacterized protein n=1 Tax=Arthrobotrys musiformis TaxID=47236 RepID=A0AAV9W764_9PEZI